MKTFIFTCLLVLSAQSFARLNAKTIDLLEATVKKSINEKAEMEGTGRCEKIARTQLKCTWYVKGGDRAPDLMIGIFEVQDNTYKLVRAYKEHGC